MSLYFITGSPQKVSSFFKRLHTYGFETLTIDHREPTTSAFLRHLSNKTGQRDLFVRGPQNLVSDKVFTAAMVLDDRAVFEQTEEQASCPVRFVNAKARAEDAITAIRETGKAAVHEIGINRGLSA